MLWQLFRLRGKFFQQQIGRVAKWYKRTEAIGKDSKDGDGHYCLVCDGIVRKRDKDEKTIENEWEQNKMRVAFLIKDQNQGKDGPWNDDARNWLIPMETDDTPKKKRRKTRNWNVSSKFLRNIAQTLWGITYSTPDNLLPNNGISNRFDEIQRCFREVPFALVECKKQGGKASISDDVLQEYLDAYKDLLHDEFRILEPHIYVCTNEKIYKFVQDYLTKVQYPGTEMTPVKSIDGKYEFEPSVTLHIPSKTIVLCSFHPSAYMSYEEFYDGVVKHYQAFVQSPYYAEFFKKS